MYSWRLLPSFRRRLHSVGSPSLEEDDDAFVTEAAGFADDDASVTEAAGFVCSLAGGVTSSLSDEVISSSSSAMRGVDKRK